MERSLGGEPLFEKIRAIDPSLERPGYHVNSAKPIDFDRNENAAITPPRTHYYPWGSAPTNIGRLYGYERDRLEDERSASNLKTFYLYDELYQLEYEASGDEFSPLDEKLDLAKIKARDRLDFCNNELQELRENGATEEQILRRVSDQVFEGTTFEASQNSALMGLAGQENKRTANCEGRAKMAAMILQEAGYDPEDQIFYESFSDHVRTVVKTAQGLRVIEAGVLPYISDPGSPLTSVQDSVRATLALTNKQGEVIEFSLGKKSYHASMADKLDTRLAVMFPKLAKRMNKRPVAGLNIANGSRRSSQRPRMLDFLMHTLTPAMLEADSSIRRVINVTLEAAKPVLKAATFLGAATAAGYGYKNAEEIAENPQAQMQALTEAIQERTEQIGDVVEESAQTVQDYFDDFFESKKSELAGEDGNDGSSKTRRSTSQPTQGSEEDSMEVVVLDHLPRELEKYGQKTFDGIDYTLRSMRTDGGSEIEIKNDIDIVKIKNKDQVVARLDVAGIYIEPHEQERVFTTGFWKCLLNEQYLKDDLDIGFDDAPVTEITVLHIQSPNDQKPLQPNKIIGHQGSIIKAVIHDLEYKLEFQQAINVKRSIIVELDNIPIAYMVENRTDNSLIVRTADLPPKSQILIDETRVILEHEYGEKADEKIFIDTAKTSP